VAVLAITGALEITAYLVNFKPVPQHTPYSESLRHPLGLLKYSATFLGHPAAPLGLNAAQVLGTIGIVLSLFFIARSIKRRGGTATTFAAGASGFVLLTAFQTAVGRVDFGYAQAVSSRYAIAAAVFWTALAVGFSEIVASSTTISVGRDRRMDVTGISFVSVCAVIVAIAGISTLPSYSTTVQARAVQDGVAAAASTDPRDGSVLAGAIASPSAIVDVQWLEREHLGPWSFADLRRVMEGSGRVKIAGLPRCPGHLDAVSVVPRLRQFTGWVIAPDGSLPSAYVEVVSTNGENRGVGYARSYRPDVVQAHASTSNETGFIAYSRSRSAEANDLIAFRANDRVPACILPLSVAG
jgi:hypothetical protein